MRGSLVRYSRWKIDQKGIGRGAEPGGQMELFIGRSAKDDTGPKFP